MADELANAMSDIEKVKTWTAAKKLSEATTAVVISLGFDSMEAVSLISPEDLGKSKIPVGQIKMLMNKGNNKITELRTILQRESPNS